MLEELKRWEKLHKTATEKQDTQLLQLLLQLAEKKYNYYTSTALNISAVYIVALTIIFLSTGIPPLNITLGTLAFTTITNITAILTLTALAHLWNKKILQAYKTLTQIVEQA